jgi:hypothetical protein
MSRERKATPEPMVRLTAGFGVKAAAAADILDRLGLTHTCHFAK